MKRDMPRCLNCRRAVWIAARGLCSRCYDRLRGSDRLDKYPTKISQTAPMYCTCATSDFDAIDQCRRCLRADARAPRVAAAIARVAARRQDVA